MILAAVVVTDMNNGIGKDNQLLCHLPADLKHFKEVTMGFPILMGRKTYESIGRVLPGRRNLVITRRPDYKIEGAEIYHTIGDALRNCTEEKVFIIGGAEIFKQTIDRTDEIYRTRISHSFPADTYFPEFENDFEMLSGECRKADAKNRYDYCFEKWVAKRKNV